MHNGVIGFVLACFAALPGGVDEGGPAVEVVMVRPDAQLSALLRLFEGSRAESPAAALAAWRRATGRYDVLSKGWQAAIAALNPEMVRELKTLDGSVVTIGFDAAGRLEWSLAVPHDDGTIEALGTALVLTDGAAMEPLGEGVAVDRLGPEGAPLLARSATGAVVLGGSREALRRGLDRLGPIEAPVGMESGWVVRLDAGALAGSDDVGWRRASGVLGGLAVERVEAVLRLEGEALELAVRSRLDGEPVAAAIEPAWLDLVPADAAGAFAFALDPAGEAVGRVFEAADGFEKADPARAGVAPLRARLNLLANAAGVRPEVEVWPALRGVSGFVEAGEDGRIVGGLLAMHAKDETSAGRLADRVVPRLARPWGALVGAGRELEVERIGATVLLGWGEGLLGRAREAIDRSERSAGGRLREAIGDRPASRVVAVWPGRTPLPRSPIAEALAEAPPVVWVGRVEGETVRDVVRWDGLRGTIRRLLERLPH